MDRVAHWENIYGTKKLTEVSWYQAKPEVSLRLIHESGIQKDEAIIDIGGGDSFLVDHLIEAGYTNITVLDISQKAIERAQERLGDKAELVNWIVSDITAFEPKQEYQLWHDRAVFHFLTSPIDIEHYKSCLTQATGINSHLIVGTFSESGPDKCSGIQIKKYSKQELAEEFRAHFKTVELFNIDHPTPFNTIQNFSFVHLERNN